MKSYTVKALSFDELSKAAQDRAISDHIIFLLEVTSYEQAEGEFKRAIDEADRMQAPWFAAEYVRDYCRDEIIESIRTNEYEFYADGSLFDFRGLG